MAKKSTLLSVWAFQSVTYLVTLAEAKDIVIILSTLVAVGYTLWRWRRDYEKHKNNIRK
ncbi:MAG: hypothetical protein R6W90_07575 [Ignavibacteriaceae bacterium]